MNKNQENASKRTFVAPKLEIYGKARDITQNVKGNFGDDSAGQGGGANNKTRT